MKGVTGLVVILAVILSLAHVAESISRLRVRDRSQGRLNSGIPKLAAVPVYEGKEAARLVLPLPKSRIKDVHSHIDYNSLRTTVKWAKSSAKGTFKKAKKAHSDLEMAKLEFEESVKALNKSMHVRNVTKATLALQEKKKAAKIEAGKNLDRAKVLEKSLLAKAEKVASKIRTGMEEIEAKEKMILEADNKKQQEADQKKRERADMRRTYYEELRKKREKKRMASMSPEQFALYKAKKEKEKAEQWSMDRDRTPEKPLGPQASLSHDRIVQAINATNSDMENVEREIKLLEAERENHTLFEKNLHAAIQGIFPEPVVPVVENETSILTECIEEVNCTNTLKNVQMCMNRANAAGITPSVDEATAQFSTCAKEKALREAALKDPESEPDLSPNRNFSKVDVKVVDDFEDDRNFMNGVWTKNGTVGVQRNSTLGAASGKTALLFKGNREGESLESDYHRSITSKAFDFREGGVISFYLKDGEDDGGAVCHAKFEELKRLEAAKMARKQENYARKEHCNSHGPKTNGGCNGHGRGLYHASCDDEWWCDTNHSRPFNPTCVCQCNQGWVGANCEIRFTTGHCRSVGDPHPNTADGVYYDIYDAGEFKYFEHPESTTDVHLLTRMAHPSIAATAAVAVRVCEKPLKEGKGNRGKCDIISYEAPNCRNGNNPRIHVTEDGVCHPRNNWFTSHQSYTTRNTGVRYHYPYTITGNNVRMYTPGWWQYGWYHHQKGAGGCDRGGACKSWYGCGNWGGYLNAYLTFTAPRDGRTQGVCGDFSGHSGRDYNEMIASGRRGGSMWGKTARDKFMVSAKDSFFKCGVLDYSYRYSAYSFKQTTRATAQQRMAMATQALAQEFAEDKIMNKNAGKASKKVSKADATKRCKGKKPAPSTEEALKSCVSDMMMVDDDQVRKSAAKESTEEIEEAYHEAEADEADEKLELIAEAKLKRPGPLDPVIQYCVQHGNTSMELKASCSEDSKGWNQLKAYPAKIYGDYFKTWKYMTARIPPAAMGESVRFRFYQKRHTCYCCDQFAIDKVKVETGGWPVRIAALQKFKLFADGKQVGGESMWLDAAKDTARFRVDANTEVFGLKFDASAKYNADVRAIGSFGDSLVTSATWKCKSFLTEEEQSKFSNPGFDDSNWPSATELGDNGVLPYGPRPGVAAKAFWISAQPEIKNSKGDAVYCRVNSSNAWHSYSKDHRAASRWSCKVWHERQSPYSIQLKKGLMSMITINADDANAHYSPKATASIKTTNQGGENILLRLRLKKIMEMNEESALLKNVALRLFVADETPDAVKICQNVESDKLYGPSTVSWNSRPRYQDCISFKANRANSYVTIDITKWVRQWIDKPDSNFGMTIVPTSRDVVSFGTELNSQTLERPRLSLNCHGDRNKIDEDAEVNRVWTNAVDELRKTEDRKRRDPVYQRKKAAEPEAKAHHYGLNATHSRIFPVDNRAGWN